RGIVDSAILFRVDERVDQGHAREADRESLRGLDLGLGMLLGAALLDGEALLGVGDDAGMELLAKRAKFLPERVILALEPVKPLYEVLQIRLALRGKRRRQRQRQTTKSYAGEYYGEEVGRASCWGIVGMKEV